MGIVRSILEDHQRDVANASKHYLGTSGSDLVMSACGDRRQHNDLAQTLALGPLRQGTNVSVLVRLLPCAAGEHCHVRDRLGRQHAAKMELVENLDYSTVWRNSAAETTTNLSFPAPLFADARADTRRLPEHPALHAR